MATPTYYTNGVQTNASSITSDVTGGIGQNALYYYIDVDTVTIGSSSSPNTLSVGGGGGLQGSGYNTNNNIYTAVSGYDGAHGLYIDDFTTITTLYNYGILSGGGGGGGAGIANNIANFSLLGGNGAAGSGAGLGGAGGGGGGTSNASAYGQDGQGSIGGTGGSGGGGDGGNYDVNGNIGLPNPQQTGSFTLIGGGGGGGGANGRSGETGGSSTISGTSFYGGGGGNGGYCLVNSGIITNLYNSQGNASTPLYTFNANPDGIVNYYIYITSLTDYGQFYYYGTNSASITNLGFNIDPNTPSLPVLTSGSTPYQFTYVVVDLNNKIGGYTPYNVETTTITNTQIITWYILESGGDVTLTITSVTNKIAEATGFKVGKGPTAIDLNQYFLARTGTAVADTNFKSSVPPYDKTDLSQIFEPYTSGTIQTTNYIIKGTSIDLGSYFQPLN